MSLTAIRQVTPCSPADRARILPGETLLRCNGRPITDVLDYKFYTYDRRLTLDLQGIDGIERTVTLRKEEGEDLGLSFETYLMDRAHCCCNDCIFCFVTQMPPGMRPSLYFKDDDARLSFLMGNYLTLTNLSPREVQRIIDLRISPINISVHTTNPALRAQMLQNSRAGQATEIMRRFAAAGITMNCQIVSCPGINDGTELDDTMKTLAQMHPAVRSVSVVPVGLTKYRGDLPPLRCYTRDEARALIAQVERFSALHKEKTGSSLIWCADEFYLLAALPLPGEDYFEDFTQLENGVGMLTLLRAEFARALKLMQPDEMAAAAPFAIATGVSAAPFLQEMIDMARDFCDTIDGAVYPIENDFFGHSITVSGLVTGKDLIAQLKKQPLPRRLLIPCNMLRTGEQVFLDDVTVSDVERELGVTVTAVEQDGYALLDAMAGLAPPSSHSPGIDTEYYNYNPPRP